MPFLSKFGVALRSLGEKASTTVSNLGHKVGNALLSAAPVVSAFAPGVGAGVASAGLVAKGVGQVGDWGRAALSGGGGGDMAALKGIGGQIRNDARAVQQAYSAGRSGVRSALERGRA